MTISKSPQPKELTGGWQVMLRMALASYPLIIALHVWLVKSVFELKAQAEIGDRFTLQDAYSMERRIDARIDLLPPPDWREKIENLYRENLILRKDMKSLNDEITRDFVRKDELK